MSAVELPAQKALVDELVGRDRWWLLVLDALRADVGAQVLPQYLDGEVHTVYNGGIGFTSDWFASTFPGDYRAMCINPQPIHSFQSGPNYDERRHFSLVPSFSEFEWDDELATCPPNAVADVVLDWLGEDVPEELRRLADLGYVDDAEAADAARRRGVVRFLQPHPPWPGLVEYTSGRADRMSKLATAVRSGEIDRGDVIKAYRAAAHWPMETVRQLVEVLDGRVVITADHGELLGEGGDWLHAGEYADRPEINRVPWMVVE